MATQRVTIWEVKKQDITLQDVESLLALPPGTLKKNFSKRELKVYWGHLSVKMPSRAATPKHLPKGLLLASCPDTPPILVTELSFEEENLSPRYPNWFKNQYNMMEVIGKTAEMLIAMKLEYTGEIIVVEEAIAVEDLNWNQAPNRRRARQSKAQRLLAEFPYDQLVAGPSRVGRNSTPNEDMLLEHQGTWGS
ncbi:hypothetical protein AMTR_s00046p00144260 [Amborella trichopoda]|uniref:Uncharacterized protein n=1 Tax=Amborella trichopoda TaxID=13333 RepID=U5DC52_AMBTC|nr:hypothetical protein AMTR_s00046p00144260 [Amborella trichopoda]